MVDKLAGLIEAEDYDLDGEVVVTALARSILRGGWKREYHPRHDAHASLTSSAEVGRRQLPGCRRGPCIDVRLSRQSLGACDQNRTPRTSWNRALPW